MGPPQARTSGSTPQNPRYLEFRGKPTVLITSGEHYGAVLNLNLDFDLDHPYLAELRGQIPLNRTRTFSGTIVEVPGSFNITDNTLAPPKLVVHLAVVAKKKLK